MVSNKPKPKKKASIDNNVRVCVFRLWFVADDATEISGQHKRCKRVYLPIVSVRMTMGSIWVLLAIGSIT